MASYGSLDQPKANFRKVSKCVTDFWCECSFNLLSITAYRYLYALQIKRDLLSGELSCQEHTAVLLASYIVQGKASTCYSMLNFSTLNFKYALSFTFFASVSCRSYCICHWTVFCWLPFLLFIIQCCSCANGIFGQSHSLCCEVMS